MRNLAQDQPRDGLMRVVLHVEAAAQCLDPAADRIADQTARRSRRNDERSIEIGEVVALGTVRNLVGGTKTKSEARHTPVKCRKTATFPSLNMDQTDFGRVP